MDDPLHVDAARVEFRRWIRPFLAVVGSYVAFRVIQTAILAATGGINNLSLANRVILSFSDGGLMLLIAPIAWWTAVRFPLTKPAPVRNHLVVIATGVTLAVVSTAVLHMVGRMLVPSTVTSSLFQAVVSWVTPNLFAYAVVIAIAHVVVSDARLRAREVHATLLETQLTTARLASLRAQLQPHFLFNTLHAISEAIHSAPNVADAMVVRLGRLLRRTLDAANHELVPLSDEIEYVRAYLDIQHLRLGERLEARYDIDPQAMSVLVPPLLLQPIVENAVRHGLTPAVARCHIVISVHAQSNSLSIEVSDDGAGLPARIVEGVGIRNTRRRLEELYGRAATFRIEGEVMKGTRVRVEVPRSTAEQLAPPRVRLSP